MPSMIQALKCALKLLEEDWKAYDPPGGTHKFWFTAVSLLASFLLAALQGEEILGMGERAMRKH
jgi:hypothetical protein